ncbi:hypothetical protein LguiB_028430 [Lonicera macranthoides]
MQLICFFKILDAIEVKSQMFMNREEIGEHQKYIDTQVMEVTRFHQVSVLSESSIKRGKLIECKNGLGELANYGAKVSTCKGLAAYEVEHRVIDEQSAEEGPQGQLYKGWLRNGSQAGEMFENKNRSIHIKPYSSIWKQRNNSQSNP